MRTTLQVKFSARDELHVDSNFRNVQYFRSDNQSLHALEHHRAVLNKAWGLIGTHTNEVSTPDISNSGINSRNTHIRMELEQDRDYMQGRMVVY